MIYDDHPMQSSYKLLKPAQLFRLNGTFKMLSEVLPEMVYSRRQTTTTAVFNNKEKTQKKVHDAKKN